MLEQPAGENRHQDVGRLGHAIQVGTRARLYADKVERAVRAGRDSAGAREALDERQRVARVFGGVVTSVGICLPDFHHAVRHRRSQAIENAAINDNEAVLQGGS